RMAEHPDVEIGGEIVLAESSQGRVTIGHPAGEHGDTEPRPGRLHLQAHRAEKPPHRHVRVAAILHPFLIRFAWPPAEPTGLQSYLFRIEPVLVGPGHVVCVINVNELPPKKMLGRILSKAVYAKRNVGLTFGEVESAVRVGDFEID